MVAVLLNIPIQRNSNLRLKTVNQMLIQAKSSARIDELAKPITRDSIFDINYNPDSFVVSKAAQKGM